MNLHNTPEMILNPYRFAGGGGGTYNLLTNASAAYSLINLDASFSGAVCRVRNATSSGSLDYTAAEILDGTLVADLAGDAGEIDRLYDQSGNGQTMIADSGSEQPRLVTSGVVKTRDGFPVIDFESYTSSGFNGASGHELSTLYLAGERTSSSNNGLAKNTGGGALGDLFSSSTVVSFDGSGSVKGAVALNGGTFTADAENVSFTTTLDVHSLWVYRFETGEAFTNNEAYNGRSGVDPYEGYSHCFIAYPESAQSADSDIRSAINTLFSIY